MAASYKQGMMAQAHDPSRPPGYNKMSGKGAGQMALDLLKRHQDSLVTGGMAAVLGFVAKKLLRMENISTNSIKQAFGSFVMVTLAAAASEEIGLASKSP